jgi:hypothetical protein
MPWDVIAQVASNLIYIAAIIAIVYFTLKIFRNTSEKPSTPPLPTVDGRTLLNLYIECRYDVRMVQGWHYHVSAVIYPINTDSDEHLMDAHVTAIHSLSVETAAFDAMTVSDGAGPLTIEGITASWLLTPLLPGMASFRIFIEVEKRGGDREVLRMLYSGVQVKRDFSRWFKKPVVSGKH